MRIWTDERASLGSGQACIRLYGKRRVLWKVAYRQGFHDWVLLQEMRLLKAA